MSTFLVDWLNGETVVVSIIEYNTTENYMLQNPKSFHPCFLHRVLHLTLEVIKAFMFISCIFGSMIHDDAVYNTNNTCIGNISYGPG